MDHVLDELLGDFGEPEIPLAEPPSVDLSLDVVCPCCGSTAAAKKEVEDACVGECPSCDTGFSLPPVSPVREMIVSVAERYEDRMERVGKRPVRDRQISEQMLHLMR